MARGAPAVDDGLRLMEFDGGRRRPRACGVTRRALLALLTFSVAGAAVLAGVAPAGASTSQASTLWSRAMAAAKAQTTVHYVEATTGTGQAITITGEVNRTSGTQRIVFKSAHQQWDSTVMLVDDTVYVSGSPYALQLTLGVPSAVFEPVAGQWISINSSAPDGIYQSSAAELTMGSVISNFAMKGPFSLGRRTHLSGVSVIGVHGYLSGTGKTRVPQTFDLKASGDPLPVASLSEAPGRRGAKTASTYSQWGAPVSVQAPANAVPLSQILQISPGGTTTTTTPQIITT